MSEPNGEFMNFLHFVKGFSFGGISAAEYAFFPSFSYKEIALNFKNI